MALIRKTTVILLNACFQGDKAAYADKGDGLP